MTQVDYTKMKVNPAKNIIKCPKCGRNGEIHKYKDGTGAVYHLKKLETDFFPIWDIKDSCYLKASDRQAMEATNAR